MPELNRAQFADIYHGTNDEHAQMIKESALMPAEGSKHVMTVAYDRRTAEDYAHDAADYYGGNPAIVHMRVPQEEWVHKYAGDQEDHGWGRASGLRAPVPGAYVHEVLPLEKEKDSYYDRHGR